MTTFGLEKSEGVATGYPTVNSLIIRLATTAM